jgi:hypothetical protein
MTDQAEAAALEPLEALIGEWSIEADIPNAPPSDVRGRVVFEWMSGRQFLVERWEVPIPEAPDGLAVIGYDAERDSLLQHYFDSRGVARLYVMTLANGVWTLERTEADFSPIDFSQRYVGELSEDGRTIAGRWEIAHDKETWELDFHLNYTRTG